MAYNPYYDWPETAAALLLALGFLVSVMARSAMFQYLLLFLAGLVFGRLMFRWRPHKKTSLVLIIIGFLMGYMIGGIWANRKLLVAIYALAIWAGWQLEKHNVFRARTFES